MRKNVSTFILVFLTSLIISSCGRAVDPVTREKAYQNLGDLLQDVFSKGPEDPWRPQNEFETSAEYEIRKKENVDQYMVDAEEYYNSVENTIYYLIHNIEELARWNEIEGYFEIPFTLSTATKRISLDSTQGPDFRLMVPPYVVENAHYYNEESFVRDGTILRPELGALSITTFYASMEIPDAKRVRMVSFEKDIYLRIGIMLDFPMYYQGYRFLPERYEPFEDEDNSFDQNETVRQMREADQVYGGNEGIVTIKLVSIEIVDQDGVILHKWPDGLTFAMTPTPSKKNTPTATLPSFLETPVVTVTPQPTKESFCPEAISTRIKVGDRAMVAYGDVKTLRIREEVGLSAEITAFLESGQEFTVVGGPECRDGFIWWKIDTENYTGKWVAEGKDRIYYIEPLD